MWRNLPRSVAVLLRGPAGPSGFSAGVHAAALFMARSMRSATAAARRLPLTSSSRRAFPGPVFISAMILATSMAATGCTPKLARIRDAHRCAHPFTRTAGNP